MRDTANQIKSQKYLFIFEERPVVGRERSSRSGGVSGEDVGLARRKFGNRPSLQLHVSLPAKAFTGVKWLKLLKTDPKIFRMFAQ